MNCGLAEIRLFPRSATLCVAVYDTDERRETRDETHLVFRVSVI